MYPTWKRNEIGRKVRNTKLTSRLLIAAWLDFGAFGRVICCLLRSLGSFGCLLFGLLTTLRILGGIFPKRTNLGMLVSGSNDRRQKLGPTCFMASLFVFPGLSARYVFICSLTKRLYAEGARFFSFLSANKRDGCEHMRTHDERERNQPTLGLALARRVAVFAEVSVENPLIRTRKGETV